MRDQYHATSTPGAPKARVRVEMDGKAGTISLRQGDNLRRVPVSIQNVRNMDEIVSTIHETMAVRLSGTQPKLEALFLERYERMRRMEAARRARLTAA